MTCARAAERLMPALRGWTLGDHWAGLRPRSPDGLPLLGPTAVEGLWLAGGQYRNGILFAPAMAETMCDQILGRAHGDSRLRSPPVRRMRVCFCIPAWQPTRVFIADWPLCRVLLMNDARYFWLVLVPRRDGVTEITDLSAADRAR